MKQINKVYNKWTWTDEAFMTRSMRRNVYMLDAAIYDANDIKLLSFAENGQNHA